MAVSPKTKKKLLLNVITCEIEDAVSTKLSKNDWTVEKLDSWLDSILSQYTDTVDAIRNYYESLPEPDDDL